MVRNGRRNVYRGVTICIILFDLFFQALLYSAVYLVFFACGPETFERLYRLIFLGQWDRYDGAFSTSSSGRSSLPTSLVESLLLAGLPHFLMLWVKTIIGLRIWVIDDFSRKSVERYFMHTFVYHIYAIVNTFLLFAINAAGTGRPSSDGNDDNKPGQGLGFKLVVGNLAFSGVYGLTVTFIQYRFTLFKDKDMRLHQELWCGDIVDSSDEEEARRRDEEQSCGELDLESERKDEIMSLDRHKRDEELRRAARQRNTNGEQYYKCTQESDACIIYFHNPNRRRRRDKKKKNRNRMMKA